MHCVFHPANAATIHCSGCNRPLCASCDHRIKGYPHCEDCIVRGVEILRRAPQTGDWTGAQQMISAPPVDKPSSKKAVLFGLFPGLGAVYNRQNLKALVHFLGVVSLGQTAGATDLAPFGFATLVFYIYTLIDANRTARRIAAGMDPREDEARLKFSLTRYRVWWGGFFVVLAILVTLSAAGVNLESRYLWAAILFLAGAYFIGSYFKGEKADDPGRTMPPAMPRRSVVAAAMTEDLAPEHYEARPR